MLLDNIKALCKERGMSLCALEKELGIGNGTVSKWADRSPRIDNVRVVANYFGVTVDDLLRDTEQDSA